MWQLRNLQTAQEPWGTSGRDYLLQTSKKTAEGFGNIEEGLPVAVVGPCFLYYYIFILFIFICYQKFSLVQVGFYASRAQQTLPQKLYGYKEEVTTSWVSLPWTTASTIKIISVYLWLVVHLTWYSKMMYLQGYQEIISVITPIFYKWVISGLSFKYIVSL